jgi:hypothetical protein
MVLLFVPYGSSGPILWSVNWLLIKNCSAKGSLPSSGFTGGILEQLADKPARIVTAEEVPWFFLTPGGAERANRGVDLSAFKV